MKRIGTLMKLKPGALETYTHLHDAIWPEVVAVAHEAGMRNYTIFHQDGYLFSYYEYVGGNFVTDMSAKDALPVSRRWQEATGALRECVEGDSKVMMLDELWHYDF